MYNEKKTYKITHDGKILKYQGELQYFRTKYFADQTLKKLKKELKRDLRVERNEN